MNMECDICTDNKLCKEFPCCIGKHVCGHCMVKMKENNTCPFCRKNINITRTQHLVIVRDSNRKGTVVELLNFFFYLITIFMLIYILYPLIETAGYCLKPENQCQTLESLDIVNYIILLTIFLASSYYNLKGDRYLGNIDLNFKSFLVYCTIVNMIYSLVFWVRTRYIFLTSYIFINIIFMSIIICYHTINFLFVNDENSRFVNNIYVHIIPSSRPPTINEETENPEPEQEIEVVDLEN